MTASSKENSQQEGLYRWPENVCMNLPPGDHFLNLQSELLLRLISPIFKCVLELIVIFGVLNRHVSLSVPALVQISHYRRVLVSRSLHRPHECECTETENRHGEEELQPMQTCLWLLHLCGRVEVLVQTVPPCDILNLLECYTVGEFKFFERFQRLRQLANF